MGDKRWPELYTMLLRRMWDTHSAAEISTALKAIGADYSRDAVLGKARRLGLGEPPRPPYQDGKITLANGDYYNPARRELESHHDQEKER